MAEIDIAGHTVPLSVTPFRGGVRYRARVPVPVVESLVPIRIDVRINREGWHPSVYATAPECLRHRYTSGALCMWWERDPAQHRWTHEDGLPNLVHHIRRHLFQEACCRAGESWPGEEAPGTHPRSPACRTC